MRSELILASVLVLAASGCRTTHEADEDEHGQLNLVDGSVGGAAQAQSDMGEGAVRTLSAIYAPLMWLSDKDRADGTSSAAIVHSEAELALLREAATFADGGARDGFPECVTETDNSVVYDGCEFGASAGGVGSVGFFLDGSYAWTDFTSDSDLTFDFGADVIGIGIGTSFAWNHGLEWTDTKLDGEFGLDWASGVSLGGVQTATSVTFRLNATIEELTSDAACDGPVAGLVDWRSTHREGMDPVESTRVTVEWLGCGDALVTW